MPNNIPKPEDILGKQNAIPTPDEVLGSSKKKEPSASKSDGEVGQRFSDITKAVDKKSSELSTSGKPNGVYTYDGRKGAIYKKVDGVWHIDPNNSGKFAPIPSANKDRIKLLEAQAKQVFNSVVDETEFEFQKANTFSKGKQTEEQAAQQEAFKKDFAAKDVNDPDVIAKNNYDNYIEKQLDNINSDVVSQDEEDAIPRIKSVIQTLGMDPNTFELTEEGAGYDAVRIKNKKTGEDVFINLSNWTSDRDNEEAKLLKGFLDVQSKFQDLTRLKEQKSALESKLSDLNAADAIAVKDQISKINKDIENQEALRNNYVAGDKYKSAAVYSKTAVNNIKTEYQKTALQSIDLKKKNDDLDKWRSEVDAAVADGRISQEQYELEYKPKIDAEQKAIFDEAVSIKDNMTSLASKGSTIDEIAGANYAFQENRGNILTGATRSFVEGGENVLRFALEGSSGLSPEEAGKIADQIAPESVSKEYLSSDERNAFEKVVFGLTNSLGSATVGALLVPGYGSTFGLYASSYMNMKDQVNTAEMADVPEYEKILLSGLYGASVGLLEKYGLSKAFSKSPVGSKVVNYILGKTFSTLPKNASAEVIEQEINKNISTLVSKGLINATGAGLIEGSTELGQEIADIGIKEVYDLAKGKDYFEGPKTGSELMSRLGESFALGMLGGASMGALSQSVNIPKTGMEMKDLARIEESIVNPNIKDIFEISLKNRVISGEITADQARSEILKLNAAQNTLKQIPETLTPEQKLESFKLISEREELNQAISKYDEALTAPERARVAEINEQLKTIAQNAVQKQTTGEVSVQPETTTSQEVEGGKPEAEPQVVTEEGQKEIVARNYTDEKGNIIINDPNYIVRGGAGKKATEGYYSWDKSEADQYADGDQNNIFEGRIKDNAKILELETNDPKNYQEISDNIKLFEEITGIEYTIENFSDIYGEIRDKLKEAGFDAVRGATIDGLATVVLNTKAIEQVRLNKTVSSKTDIDTKSMEIDDVTSDPATYSQSLGEAITAMKEEGKGLDLQVSPVSVEDASAIVKDGGKIFMTKDRLAGGYVKRDGYMGGLFKNPKSPLKKISKAVQQARVEAGGFFMDAYATELEPMYIKNGFRPVARLKFNEEYAPEGWDAENSPLKNKPDVVFFAYDPDGKYNVGDGEYVESYDQAYEMAKNVGSDLKATREAAVLSEAFGPTNVPLSKQVKRAQKAIAKILPDVQIVVHNTEDEYRKATGETDSKQQASRGEYNPTTNTIHINKSKANGRTIAHEVFHAVIIKKVGTDAAATQLTDKMIRAVDKAVKRTGNKELASYLNNFMANYNKNVQSEEKMAELVGYLAENFETLPLPTRNIIKQWIDSLLKRFGIKPMTDNEIVELMNTIAGKVAVGEEITYKEFNGGSKVSKPSDGLTSRKQYGNETVKVEVRYLEQERMDELIKSGLVKEVNDLSSINGQRVVTTSPDDMLVGSIYVNGKEVATGNGGIFFVTKFGDVWANSNKGVAKGLASAINEASRANGGKAYLVLVKGTDAKLVSSPQGVTSSLAVTESMLDAGLFSLSDFRAAIRSAVKDAGGTISLSQNGSAKTLKNELDSFFSDVTASTFEKRGNVLKAIIANLAKSESATKNKSEIIKFLNGDTSKGLGVGSTPKSQSLVDLVAKVSAEQLTKGLNTGDIYGVIEINGEVDIFEDQHQSYPYHIKIVDKNGKVSSDKPVLILPKNRKNGREILTSIDGQTSDDLGSGFAGKVGATANMPYGKGIIQDVEQPSTRKQIIGENANLSQNVRDNLQVARDMESAGKSVKDIRIATGWERGIDGKWRYEIQDYNPKRKLTNTIDGMDYKLNEILNNNELFKTYPSLNEISVVISKIYGNVGSGTFFPSEKLIGIGRLSERYENQAKYIGKIIDKYSDDIITSVNNINEYEKTIYSAERDGGLSKLDAQKYAKEIFPEIDNHIENALKNGLIIEGEKTSDFNYLTDKIYDLGGLNEGDKFSDKFSSLNYYESIMISTLLHEIQHAIQDIEGFSEGGNYTNVNYEKLAGEVEARNVEKRMKMTPEERRQTTLQETEDVSREDQIIFFDNKEVSKRKQLSPEIQSALTEDGKGNYVFHHYSEKRRDTIKPGSGTNIITGKDEGSALSAVGGLAQYYTMKGQAETGVGNELHTVLVPMYRVYDFYKDPDNLLDEAQKRFEKARPGQAFSPNYQLAFITQVANENGYDMVVAPWRNNEYRAQTTLELTPEATNTQMKDRAVETYNVGDSVEVFGMNATITDVNGPVLTYKGEGVEGQINVDRNPRSIKKSVTTRKQIDNEAQTLENRKQKKDDTLYKIVQKGRELGLSDAGIRKYAIDNGYTDKQISDAIVEYNLTEEGIFVKGEGKAIVDSIKSFKRRMLSARSFLPKSVFKLKEQKDANIAYHLNMVDRNVKDFNRLYKAYKGDKDVLLKNFDAYLRGDKNVKLDEDFKIIANSMRNQVDGLSRQLIASGLVEESQIATIAENLGSYLTRSYAVYERDNWKKEVSKEVLQKAKNYLREQYRPWATEMAQKEGMDIEQLLDERVDAEVDLILTKDDKSMFAKGGKEGSKNLSVLKERMDIPVEIRMLMGEYTDPGLNYAQTVLKLSALAENHKFLTEVRKSGLGKFFYEKNDPRRPKEFNTEIAAKGSETMNPLNGLYTTKEVADAFSKQPRTTSELMQLYMKVQSFVKWNKTIGSVATHAKNVVGNVGFIWMNSHADLSAISKAYSSVRNDLFNKNNKELRELMDKYIKLGIVKQSAGLGEIRDMFKDANWDDAMAERLSNKDLNFGQKAKRKVLRAKKKAEDWYQAEDDFFKIVAYENESARYSEAMFGKKYKELTDQQKKEVDDVTSEIVKNVYPTYDRIPEAIQLIRRFPFMGNFVSFQAEAYRTMWNTMALAKQELSSDNTEIKKIGAKRLVGATTYVATKSAVIGYLSMAAGTGFTGLMGYLFDDDEERQKEKDIREFIAPWSKNSDLMILESGNGKIKYIDFSATDPHGGLKKAMNAFFLSDDPIDGLISALGAFIDPFVGEEMTTSAILDLRNNKDKYGKNIFNPEASLFDTGLDITKYIYNVIEPGTISSVRRGIEAEDKTRELTANLTGYRVYDVDVKEQFGFKVRDLSERIKNAKKIYNAAFYNEDASDEKVQKEYNRSQKALDEIYQEMIRIYNSAERLGVNQDDLKITMAEFGNMSKRDIRSIQAGEIPQLKEKTE